MHMICSRSWTEDKGIHLELDAPADPLFMKGNPQQLQRMLGNLLDNAIKNPDAGHIKFSWRKPRTTSP